MDTTELTYYIVVYNQNRTVYGYVGYTVILICPLSPPAESGRTTWRGPPSNIRYFINDNKNPSIDRGERLSVILNTTSGAYNLRITNLAIGVDDGMFSCEVNTNPFQQYFVNLKFYGEYINLYKLDDCSLISIFGFFFGNYCFGYPLPIFFSSHVLNIVHSISIEI